MNEMNERMLATARVFVTHGLYLESCFEELHKALGGMIPLRIEFQYPFSIHIAHYFVNGSRHFTMPHPTPHFSERLLIPITDIMNRILPSETPPHPTPSPSSYSSPPAPSSYSPYSPPQHYYHSSSSPSQPPALPPPSQ